MIEYFSHRHAATELNNCTTRYELLAVVKALRKFRVYLLGRPFLLRTHHTALRWLPLTPPHFGQQERWMVEVEEFDLEVAHRARKKALQCRRPFCRPYRPCIFCKEDVRCPPHDGEHDAADPRCAIS